MDKEYRKFLNNLAKAHTEEDVKHAYSLHFKIAYDTSDRLDLYTPQVLFEFKYDKNFENPKAQATILAQILYYVHRFKYGYTNKAIPRFLCLADKNEAIITETITWKKYYTDTENYDWDLAPSIPDKKLVEDLTCDNIFRNLHIFKLEDTQDYRVFNEDLTECLDPQQHLDLIDKKIITEKNFEEVFEYWNGIFGNAVKIGFKTSKYFICDIQKGSSHLIREQGKVFFDFGSGEGRTKKILLKDYEFFWRLYEKVISSDTIHGILSKIDRLTEEEMRRFHGEFFTPLRFANKALEYIEKTVGKEWWKSGEYRIWDMAAGTGNLEWYLPSESYQHLYLSTLYQGDVEHCEKLFQEATIFQYDYLNDDVANLFLNDGLDFNFTWKLPEKLRNDLANPKLKWIILINPPFATSQKAGLNHGDSKIDVSNTQIRKIMHKENLGEVSRELFAQFIFRIKREFEYKNAIFGLFSKIKYIISNNDQKFRDNVFNFEFNRGFIFSSLTFSGTKGNFPVGFLVWNLQNQMKIEEQNIEVDIFNDNVEKIGYKKVTSENRETILSKWIKRPPATIKFPPIGSAITLKIENIDRRDRIAENFIASFMCAGNDFQQQNNTALLSAPYVSAGALSVIPENFEKAMVVHAVRRIPKATWINDRDQFLQPKIKLSQEFVNDCVVWNLFSNSNQTASMKDVEYEEENYQIKNHFFPFLLNEIKNWEITDSDISMQFATAEDRFVAKWLSENELSIEAQNIVNAGKEIYNYYFRNLHILRTSPFKITTWDAGFWQIKKALQDQHLAGDFLKNLKTNHD
nr:hypothetical protein [Melioribacteraceae bacterium]